MTKKMLDDFTVVDFTHVLAGPHCTKMLAEHGAEVIKIEPTGGEMIRVFPSLREGRSAHFVQHNIGKKTVAIDITTAEGQKICHELVKQADVVVENFAPGVMKKHNLDWEALKQLNPDLVMCSISCFGQTGPLSHLPGFDYIGQAYAGIIDLTGERGRPPVFGEYAFGDLSTSTHAYAAILTALIHRMKGGGGQYLDISLMEVLFSYHEMNVQLYDTTEGEFVCERSGPFHPLFAPVGIYPCKDRYIFIIGLNHSWDSLMKIIGREDMLSDPRLADVNGRGKHADEINAAIEAWLGTVEDVNAAVATLQEKRIPCAPILTIPEVMELEHTKARGIVRTVSDPVFGEIKIPRTPLRFSEFPEPPDLQAGTLGEYNHEILSQRLGYTEQQITDLESDGIIAEKNI
ncbi:MAG: hypothetical protein DRR42_23840 [Gammaproteobacteria bacterium]|nr:MAG: hypothetical protein DRR42_23840 [Gammaproteobacteria bacterium]